MGKLGSEVFDITCEMRGESEKAIKYFDGKIEFWVPKSMIARGDFDVVNNETGTITLTGPVWWFREKGVL
jgi:hypothetical protein